MNDSPASPMAKMPRMSNTYFPYWNTNLRYSLDWRPPNPRSTTRLDRRSTKQTPGEILPSKPSELALSLLLQAKHFLKPISRVVGIDRPDRLTSDLPLKKCLLAKYIAPENSHSAASACKLNQNRLEISVLWPN